MHTHIQRQGDEIDYSVRKCERKSRMDIVYFYIYLDMSIPKHKHVYVYVYLYLNIYINIHKHIQRQGDELDHSVRKCEREIRALQTTLGYLLLGCSIISVSFIIYMLPLLLMPLVGLHFCSGLDFVTPLVVIFFK
jgi:hypothetical protein